MPLRAADFESAAYAIPPLRAERQCRRVVRASGRQGPIGRGTASAIARVSAGTDARLAQPQNRRPEGPPDRGGPSLDDGLRRPRPAPRPHPARASPRRRPRRLQRPRRALPGPAVRARRADGPRSRPGVRLRPGGVLLGVPEPDLVPWRQRQVVAQPHLRQRRDGHAASAQASAGPAVPRARRRELAAAGRRRGRSGADRGARPSGRAPSPARWPGSPTTSGRRSSCTTSRATTTPRSPR